jgi:hypothetical protein
MAINMTTEERQIVHNGVFVALRSSAPRYRAERNAAVFSLAAYGFSFAAIADALERSGETARRIFYKEARMRKFFVPSPKYSGGVPITEMGNLFELSRQINPRYAVHILTKEGYTKAEKRLLPGLRK